MKVGRQTHAHLSANSCAGLSRAVHEPLAGTAPHVDVWICIEHEGAWGSHPLNEGSLSPAAFQALTTLTDHDRVTALAIRRLGRHPRSSSHRSVMIAHSNLTSAALFVRDVTSELELAEVLSVINLAELRQGIPPAGWARLENSVTLICTNGKRDLCCAIEGRRLIDELGDIEAHDYWECSHVGGHRYAPNVLLLPSGLVLGQVSASDLTQAHTEHPPLHRLRGRSCLEPAAQAAEIMAASNLEFGSATSISISARNERTASVEVASPTQRISMDLICREHSDASPLSCDSSPQTRAHWLLDLTPQGRM